MNKKGMTLVELIVTFSLVLVIVVGLYNLILEIKIQLEDKQIIKDVTEYSATINNKIHYDMLDKNPFAIFISSDGSNWSYIDKSSNVTEVSGGYKIVMGALSTTASVPVFENVCKKTYPCAVYYFKYNGGISNKAISLSKGVELPLGLIYEGIFEEVPNQPSGSSEVGYVSKTEENLDKINFGFSNDKKMFIMNFPIYIEGDNINYGFKIAYPIA